MNKKQIPHFNARMTQQGLDYINKKPCKMNKEEILDKHDSQKSHIGRYHRVEMLAAMEEYALSQLSGELERLKGEHKEMRLALKEVLHLNRYFDLISEDFRRELQSLIAKIESNGK